MREISTHIVGLSREDWGKTQIVLDSLSAAPGAGKVLGCQAKGSHLNLPWELREVSAPTNYIHGIKRVDGQTISVEGTFGRFS